ncbi:hypothetical protein F6X40_27530 [Paraburkholderia sp. UCT31]|uniref:hypothetical protein n=1 Tax=Paraburkholderia sp. UCT31 TaxID=2615209 RepID=UPI001655ED4B|nr:hypothetical protein [Paraburkholderia sp. UCT31]MBC8740413.1 hypothetical protein [Paraburkholderia sp. UCT31]
MNPRLAGLDWRALLIPSRDQTPLYNAVTVVTFGGWAIFMSAILCGLALLLLTGVQTKPLWLRYAGGIGAVSFAVGVLANVVCSFWFYRTYFPATDCRHAG